MTDDIVRHTGQLCDLDSVAFIRSAAHDLPEEHDVITLLPDRNAVVVDAGNLSLELRELMVMGGEQCLGTELLCVSDVLDNCPGDRETVVGGCPAPDSSRIRREFFVAWRRIFATSLISTMRWTDRSPSHRKRQPS